MSKTMGSFTPGEMAIPENGSPFTTNPVSTTAPPPLPEDEAELDELDEAALMADGLEGLELGEDDELNAMLDEAGDL